MAEELPCDEKIIDTPLVNEDEIRVTLSLIPLGVKGAGANRGIDVNCAPGALAEPIRVTTDSNQWVDNTTGFTHKFTATNIRMSLLPDANGIEVVLELQQEIIGGTELFPVPIDPCDGIGKPPCGTGINLTSSGISTSCDETVQNVCEKACDKAGGTECDIQICKSKCINPQITIEDQPCNHYVVCSTNIHSELRNPEKGGSFACGILVDKCGLQRCCPCNDGWGIESILNPSCPQTLIDGRVRNASVACPYVLELEYPTDLMLRGESQKPIVSGAKCTCGSNELKFTLLEGSGKLNPKSGEYIATESISELAYCPIIKIQVCCKDSPEDCSEPFEMRVTNPDALVWSDIHAGGPGYVKSAWIYTHCHVVRNVGDSRYEMQKHNVAIGCGLKFVTDRQAGSIVYPGLLEFEIPTWMFDGLQSTFQSTHCAPAGFVEHVGDRHEGDWKAVEKDCCSIDPDHTFCCRWLDHRSLLNSNALADGCCITELDLPSPYIARRMMFDRDWFFIEF